MQNRMITIFVVCGLIFSMFVFISVKDGEKDKKRCEIFTTYEIGGKEEREMPTVNIELNAAYGPNWSVTNNELPRLFDMRIYGHNLPIKQNQTWDTNKEYWWYTSTMYNLVKAIKPGILRFPGGGIADTAYFDRTNSYLWYQGPEGYNATIRADAIDMFVAFCREVGAEPMIQINFKSKNVQMAADMVRYANVEKGYNIKYWELGQRPELYPGYTIARYQEDFTLFANEMLLVDPTIKLIGPSNANPKVQWYDWALRNLTTTLSIISTQFYPLDGNANTSAPNYPYVHNLFNYDTPTGLAEVSNFSQRMNNARMRWNESAEIAITELAAMTNGNKHNLSDSFAYALYLGDVLMRMASKGVNLVAQWKLIDENFNDTLIKHDSSNPMKHLYLPTPAYYTYLMLTNYFGDVLIYANSSNDKELSSYATLYSSNESKMSLLVVNKNLNDDVVASININNWSISGDALVYTLSAPKPESTINVTINDYELNPESIFESMTYIPIRKINSPSSGFWYTFPKHSLTIIEFSGQNMRSSENTPPSIPQLDYPPQGAAFAEKPYFSWNPSTDTQGDKITYQIQIANEGTFSGLILDTKTKNTVYNMAYNLPMGKYYWRVRAFDGNAFNSYSAWSEVRDFTVGENTPPTVVLISPSNGGIAKGQMIRLKWDGNDAQAHPLKYNLYLDKTDGSTLVAENISTEHYDIELENGIYKWKVSVTDGEYSATSEIWTFTKSVNALPNAELVSPYNNSVILKPWVELIWRGYDDDSEPLKYDIYVETLGSGLGFEKVAELYDGVKYNYSISKRGTYRWYVQPNDGWEYGLGSKIYTFDVEISVNSLPTVSLLAPKNGAIVGSAQVTLIWNASDLDEEQTTYDIYLDTSPTPSVKLFSGVTENKCVYTALSGTKYYWRVDISDGKGKSSSEVWSFTVNTVSGNKPPVFGNVQPVDGLVINENKVGINWSASDPENEPLTYKIFIGREGLIPQVFDAGANTNFILTGLYRGRYVWFVCAYDGTNAKTTDTRVLTVDVDNAPPDTPSQLSPGDAAIFYNGLVVLRCEQVRDPERAPISYNFEVSSSPDFAGSQIYNSRTNYVVLALKEGVYYWRVNATDGELCSPWSNVWKITIENGTIPLNLTNPKEDIIVNQTTTILRWDPLPGAVYAIYLSQERALVENQDLTVRVAESYADSSFHIGNLQNGTYYWTVNATAGGQNANYPIGKFVVLIGAEPELRFKKEKYSVLVNEVVKFQAEIINKTAEFQYYFDFGDGTTSGWLKEPIAEHKYNKTGKYNVTIVARDIETGAVFGPANTKVEVNEKSIIGTSMFVIIVGMIISAIVIIVAVYIFMRKRQGRISKNKEVRTDKTEKTDKGT